jgi:ubiquitin-protein ligase
MSFIIGFTETKYNTLITDITIDDIKYKYYCNKSENVHFLTSVEQNKEIIDYINIMISNNCELDLENICSIIKKYKLSEDTDKIIIEDKYNIFNIKTNTKYKHNFNILLNNFLTKYNQLRKKPINIPKDLYLNTKQLANMIITDIEKVNNNMDYPHYIVCNNNDLMNLSIRLIYNKNELGNIMDTFNSKHGYNYFEINMKLSELHPFLPPTISYVKPTIDTILIRNILGLDIWKASTWNYTITLDWIIVNLANALQPHFIKYIDKDDKPFDFIQMKMLELYKTNCNNIIDLKINTNNIIINTGFKAGTGYGNSKNTKWDITQFIDINKSQEENDINILSAINNYINNSNIINNNIINNNDLFEYVINKFTGINLFVFNNNINMYKVLIDTLNLIIKNININMINHINIIKAIKETSTDLIQEIKMIITNDKAISSIEEIYICTYLHYIDVIEKYSKIYSDMQLWSKQKKIDTTELQSNIDNYIKMIKENNYNLMQLDNTHRFYKEKTKQISSKTIIRIMSELSSLKKDLPINWDSSVIIRIIPTNTNLLSFIISGPKDTPYHNGLFEFHAYFPDNYPSSIPQVLINTTDGNKVRFNPNLYANGKVCLSLLGTWHAEKGESWIPEISTFFQVIISIQSLILVDEPYFNEPGYESTSNTPNGKKQSALYNDNIRYETVRVAMIGMLKNKPVSYEKFIEEHFKLKKNDIIEIVTKWYEESNNKTKFKIVLDELIDILNTL